MVLSHIRPSYLAGAIGVLALGGLLLFRPWATGAAGNTPVQRGSNVIMNCEPGQQALVRQAVVNGEPQVTVNCVTAAGQTMPAFYTDEYGRQVPYGAVGAAPVAYGQPYVSQPVYRTERVVRPVRTVNRQRVVTETAPRRSWKKSALIIGGSAGAGAGIGGLIGGKKGALIGAAIGGGGASIYEATKR